MTTITDQDGQADAGSWKTLRTLVYVSGIGAALFMAGVSYGGTKDTAVKLDTFITTTERTYVRKDGRELAEIKGELKLMNEKLDYMIRQRR